MKNKLLKVSITLMAGLISIAPLAYADPVEIESQLDKNEELRNRLRNTLENMQGAASGTNLAEAVEEQFKYALERVSNATQEELEAIPSSLYNNMRILELSSGQLRLTYDPSLQTKAPQNSSLQAVGTPVTIQSTGSNYDSGGLDTPEYPDEVGWAFNVDPSEEEPDPDQEGSEGGEKTGVCRTPGTPYRERVTFMNIALISMAVKDIAEQVCNQTVVLNVSLACIVTDVIAYVALGFNENQSLCNEHIGAAEVSATWAGLNVVHGNVQHVHEDLASVDSDLSTHNSTVREDISDHDGDVKTQLTTHDTNIDTDLAAHDANIDGDLIQHDSDMKSQLATHDADIKARLATIQSTVDENQRLIKISMSRQLEGLRLLITPEGRREINSEVLTCTGDNCPSVAEVLICSTGDDWPCK